MITVIKMSNNSITISHLHPLHKDRLIRFYSDNGETKLRQWIDNNLLDYYIDNGEMLEDYCKLEINNLRNSFGKLDINVSQHNLFCIWCDWSRRFDVGWLSDKDNSTKEYDGCRDYYLKKVGIK